MHLPIPDRTISASESGWVFCVALKKKKKYTTYPPTPPPSPTTHTRTHNDGCVRIDALHGDLTGCKKPIEPHQEKGTMAVCSSLPRLWQDCPCKKWSASGPLRLWHKWPGSMTITTSSIFFFLSGYLCWDLLGINDKQITYIWRGSCFKNVKTWIVDEQELCHAQGFEDWMRCD